MPFLFALTLFVSATLLFLVQPMVAKMVLPLLGGTPAVWNTCMVFFQAALLAGYAYAHVTTTWLGTRRQVLVHAVLLALPLLVLPISIKNWVPPSDANPIPSLLFMLTLSVGLPFFVLSASAPLLQKWFAATDHPSAKDPYFLYAASNVGSMLALFVYPALVEPNLHLKSENWFSFDTQSGLWALGYAVLAVLMVVCGWVVWQRARSPFAEKTRKIEQEMTQAERDALDDARPSLLTKLHWLALAFVPSSFMLGVTTYITLDIAAIPLLWVIPLGLYLLSFILVFARWPAVMHKMVIVGAPLVILLLVFVRLSDPKGVILKISLNLLALFMVAMICHGELARMRPATRYLTGFYLLMSLGGVLGGLFNALVAPLVFNGLYEYPLAIIVACMLVPPLGAAGGTSVSVWVLKALANRRPRPSTTGRKHEPVHLQETRIRAGSRETDSFLDAGTNGVSGSRIGDLANGLLSFFEFIETDRFGWMIGLLFDVVFAFVLSLITLGFIAFFRQNSETAAWAARLPSWLGSFHDWVLARIEHRPDGSWFTEAQLRAILTYGVPILIGYSFVSRPVRFGLGVAALFLATHFADTGSRVHVIHRERTFFGVLYVENWESGGAQWYRLMHGTTIHGLQIRGNGEDFDPQTYYHREGPVGHLFDALKERLANKDIALIGLGSGTLSCYGRRGQHLEFYDIDRAAERIAKNPEYFTYYQNCQADKHVTLGDARLKLADAPDGMYQLIVVDAFSSDAIPIHLITREAMQLYFKKLKPDGVVFMHISNRYLDLEPVLGNLAEDLNLVALREYDSVPDGDPLSGRKYSADWVALARKAEDLGSLATNRDWQPPNHRWVLADRGATSGWRALAWDDLTTKLHDSFSAVPELPDDWKNLSVDQLQQRIGYANLDAAHSAKIGAIRATLGQLETIAASNQTPHRLRKRKVGVWTDDFSNLLSVFDWKN